MDTRIKINDAGAELSGSNSHFISNIQMSQTNMYFEVHVLLFTVHILYVVIMLKRPRIGCQFS